MLSQPQCTPSWPSSRCQVLCESPAWFLSSFHPIPYPQAIQRSFYAFGRSLSSIFFITSFLRSQYVLFTPPFSQSQLGKISTFWSVLSAIFGPPLGMLCYSIIFSLLVLSFLSSGWIFAGIAYGINFIVFNIVKTAPPYNESQSALIHLITLSLFPLSLIYYLCLFSLSSFWYQQSPSMMIHWFRLRQSRMGTRKVLVLVLIMGTVLILWKTCRIDLEMPRGVDHGPVSKIWEAEWKYQ